MADFLSVFIICGSGRVAGEIRYYFGDCSLPGKRLEILYPGGKGARETNKKLESIPQIEKKRALKVERRADHKRKQKETTKA